MRLSVSAPQAASSTPPASHTLDWPGGGTAGDNGGGDRARRAPRHPRPRVRRRRRLRRPRARRRAGGWTAGRGDVRRGRWPRSRRRRLLVPVVAVLGEVEYDDRRAGARQDQRHGRRCCSQGADGRLALLAFTGTATLAAWNPEARPVPGRRAGSRRGRRSRTAPTRWWSTSPARCRSSSRGRTCAAGRRAGSWRRVGGSGAAVDSARRGNDRLASCVDRSVPTTRGDGADPQAEAAHIVSHPHRPPCTTGRRVRSRRLGLAALRGATRASVDSIPLVGERRDWLPLGQAEAFCRFPGPSRGR